MGVNEFRRTGAIRDQPVRMDPAVEARQRESLARLRRASGCEPGVRDVAQVEQAARTSDSLLMPLFIAAVDVIAPRRTLRCPAPRLGEYQRKL